MSKREFEMSEEQMQRLLDACKPVPYLVVGGTLPRSPQENANAAWSRLGNEMGFEAMSVCPIPGKSVRFFTAEPIDAAREGEGETDVNE